MAVPCSANKIFIPTYRKKRFSCQGHDCSTTTIFLVRFNRYTRTRFVTLREKKRGGKKEDERVPPKMTSSFPDLLKIFFDERRACPVKIKSSKVPFINQRGILLSSSLIASSASDAHPAGNQKGKHFEKRDSTLYPSRRGWHRYYWKAARSTCIEFRRVSRPKTGQLEFARNLCPAPVSSISNIPKRWKRIHLPVSYLHEVERNLFVSGLG